MGFDIHLLSISVIGLSIDSGLFIKKIEPGSAAAEEETLSIGDKILTVWLLIFFVLVFISIHLKLQIFLIEILFLYVYSI